MAKEDAIDWTFGGRVKHDDLLLEEMLNAKNMFHQQVALCHDLMDMSGWSRKDPMAYLAECYRAAAMGIGHIDQAIELYLKRQQDSQPGPLTDTPRET